jgi:hypothetical protein
LHYNVFEELVTAAMSVYKGVQAKVKYNSDQLTDQIDLSIGILHGGTLAPYLFVMLRDYVMREARLDQTLGLKIVNSRPRCPTKYSWY